MWIDAATPLVGEDNAESATDMLLGMCMAEPYGEEAVEKYAADPDSTAFNCYFLGGVEKFVMNGDTITGLDAQGQEVFAHTYQKLDVDNENSFLFYQSEDADSGEFITAGWQCCLQCCLIKENLGVLLRTCVRSRRFSLYARTQRKTENAPYRRDQKRVMPASHWG